MSCRVNPYRNQPAADRVPPKGGILLYSNIESIHAKTIGIVIMSHVILGYVSFRANRCDKVVEAD